MKERTKGTRFIMEVDGEEWFGGFIGVDRITGEEVTGVTEYPDRTNEVRRTDDFMAALGYVRVKPTAQT